MKSFKDTKCMMAFWFRDMAYSLEHSETKWEDEDELRNWAVFEFILFNYNNAENKDRFLNNIEQTMRGLENAVSKGS